MTRRSVQSDLARESDSISRRSDSFLPQTTITVASSEAAITDWTTWKSAPSPCPPPQIRMVGFCWRFSKASLKMVCGKRPSLGSTGIPVAQTASGESQAAIADIRADSLATHVRSLPRCNHVECGCSSVTTVISGA